MPSPTRFELEEFVSKNAGFKAKLPCKPSEEAEDYSHKASKQYGYLFRCSERTTRVLITFSDHNPDTPTPLEKLFGHATGDYEFLAKKMSLQKSEYVSVGAFPGKRYQVTGNGQLFYTLVTTNPKGSLTLTISFPDSTLRPGEEAQTDELMANEVLQSVAFVSE